MFDKVPAPPTDNLYKMFTGMGLLLIAIGMVGPAYTTKATGDRYYQLYRQAVADQGDTWAALAAEWEKNRPEKLQDKVVDSIIRKSDRQAESSVQYMKLIANDMEFYSRSFQRSCLMGFTMTVWGVGFWYFRHQRYQDKTAVCEAERAALEVEKLRHEIQSLTQSPPSTSTPATSPVVLPPVSP